MRIALIADAYPPLRTSGAVQVRDLARELAAQRHDVTVIVPEPGLPLPWRIDRMEGVEVLRLPTLATKDIGYVRRTIAEALLPVRMLRGLRRSPLGPTRWQAVVWYSPSIFLGFLAGALKRASACRGYLILRDIFPEWAVDMGLMRRGLAYALFKLVERHQYSVADVIGVQSASNLPYLSDWERRPGRRLEVLHNWLAPATDAGCSIAIASTPLAGRKVLVYAGNMGVAQGMDILLDVATALRPRADIGLLFVGRGSDVPRLRELAAARSLSNVLFFEEIDPAEIPGLLRQCHVGLVALDPRHRTHNVPGKFLAYLQAGLPVLARINAGNDLIALIETHGVGRAYVGDSAEALAGLAATLCDDEDRRRSMADNARRLAAGLFAVSTAARQVAAAAGAS